MKQKVFFKTFGCRSNFYDTQIMKTHTEKDYEIVGDEQSADVIVINSCTVTNGADAGVQNYLNKYSHKKIFFTGCGINTKGKMAYDKNQIFSAFPHSQKENITQFLSNNLRLFVPESNSSHIDSTIVTNFGTSSNRNRAFVKIQEGCNFSCSYCIIPSVRGMARSLAQTQIIEQCKVLADNGIIEIVLTGTNVGSYGNDNDTHISTLIKEIAKIQNIERIRIGSLEPSQIDERFIDVLQEPKVERHLHIALQHTSDTMLEIMNRRNRFENDMKLLNLLSAKGFALGSDYIVGHPGENQSVWDEALNNLAMLPLTHIHPFIYSARSGTKSAVMKQEIKGNIAKERLHAIKNLIEQNNFIFRQNYSSTPLEVIIESSDDDRYRGLDQFFNPIIITSKQNLKNRIILDKYEISKEGTYGQI